MGFDRFSERSLAAGAGAWGLASGASSVETLTAGLFGARVDVLLCTSRDTVDRTVSVEIRDGFGDNVTVATLLIPAGAGTTVGVPAVDMLAAVPALADGILLTQPGTVALTCATAVTADNDLGLYYRGGQF